MLHVANPVYTNPIITNKNPEPTTMLYQTMPSPLSRSYLIQQMTPRNSLGGKYLVLPKKLGQGAQSRVLEGFNIDSFQPVAVKIVRKKEGQEVAKQQLDNEIRILGQLTKEVNSDFFVKLYDVFERKLERCLILEKIDGGELYNLCLQYPHGMPEQRAKAIFYQILQAVSLLHSNNIVHLDLKLENIMYNQETSSIKILDFGFASETTSTDPFTGRKSDVLQTNFCGSVHYAAPEVIKQKPYDGKKADTWSLGILLFAMVCGQFPFDDASDDIDSIFEKILTGRYRLPGHLSQEVTEMIMSMLSTNPEHRPSAKDLLLHPWFHV